MNRIGRVMLGTTGSSCAFMMLNPYIKGASDFDIFAQSILVVLFLGMAWTAGIYGDKK